MNYGTSSNEQDAKLKAAKGFLIKLYMRLLRENPVLEYEDFALRFDDFEEFNRLPKTKQIDLRKLRNKRETIHELERNNQQSNYHLKETSNQSTPIRQNNNVHNNNNNYYNDNSFDDNSIYVSADCTDEESENDLDANYSSNNNYNQHRENGKPIGNESNRSLNAHPSNNVKKINNATKDSAIKNELANLKNVKRIKDERIISRYGGAGDRENRDENKDLFASNQSVISESPSHKSTLINLKDRKAATRYLNANDCKI